MNSYNKLIHILVLIADLYLFKSPVGVIEFILVPIASLYLFRSSVGVTKLILVPIADLYLFRSLVGSYRAYTCTYNRLILVHVTPQNPGVR